MIHLSVQLHKHRIPPPTFDLFSQQRRGEENQAQHISYIQPKVDMLHDNTVPERRSGAIVPPQSGVYAPQGALSYADYRTTLHPASLSAIAGAAQFAGLRTYRRYEQEAHSPSAFDRMI